MESIQRQIRQNVQSMHEEVSDLHRWEESIGRKDAELRSNPTPNGSGRELPPIRGSVSARAFFGRSGGDSDDDTETIVTPGARSQSSATSTKSKKRRRRSKQRARHGNKNRPIDYDAWARFDVDAALEEIDAYSYYSEETGDTPRTTQTATAKATDGAPRQSSEKPTPAEVASSHVGTRSRRLNQLKANEIKDLGNKAFKDGDYETAVSHYTEAIALDALTAVYPANRAMAYLKMGEYHKTIADSTRAIELDEHYLKAYFRRAAAHEALGDFHSALTDYQHLHKRRPRNKEWGDAVIRLLRKSQAAPAPAPTPAPSQAANKDSQKDREKDNSSKKKKKRKRMLIQEVDDTDAEVVDAGALADNDDPMADAAKVVTKVVHSKAVDPHAIAVPVIVRRHQQRFDMERALVADLEAARAARLARPKQPSSPSPSPSPSAATTASPAAAPAAPAATTASPAAAATSPSLNAGTRHVSEDIELSTPTTMVEFTHTWGQLAPCSEQAAAFLRLIPPGSYPQLFNTQLTDTILCDVLATLHAHQDAALLASAAAAFAQVPRFSMLTMFMSGAQTETLRAVFAYLSENTTQAPDVDVAKLAKEYGL